MGKKSQPGAWPITRRAHAFAIFGSAAEAEPCCRANPRQGGAEGSVRADIFASRRIAGAVKKVWQSRSPMPRTIISSTSIGWWLQRQPCGKSLRDEALSRSCTWSRRRFTSRSARSRSSSGSRKRHSMGQKVNPIGLRLGINRTWDSRWFADGADYGVCFMRTSSSASMLEKRLRRPASAGSSSSARPRRPASRFTRHVRVW